MTNELSMQELLDQQEQELNKVQVGQTITGKISRVNNDELVLDLDYGFDGVIKIEELPNSNNLETIEITDFNDLIDLEETLKLPIMYINIIPNKESWFILIHNNFFYRYILKIK